MEWTCTLRDGLTWSDGQPLTSQDVAFSFRFVIDNKIPQYKSYFPFEPDLRDPQRHHVDLDREGADLRADMPPWVYIVPEHVWAQYDGKDLKEIRSRRRTRRRGERSVHAHRAGSTGQGWTMERNPNFWGEEPDGRPHRVPPLLEPGGDDPGASKRRDRLRGRDRSRVDPSVEGTRRRAGRSAVVSDWWLNLAFNFGGQGPDADAVARAARHDGAPGDRDGDRQAGDRGQGLSGHRDAGRHDHPARRRPTGTWISRAEEEYPLRSRRRQRAARRRPGTSTPTTTASERIPRPASRSSC